MLKKVILLKILLFAGLVSFAFPGTPKNYVTDDADVLSVSELDKLNQKLKDFEYSSTNQIFVYIASSLNGENMEQLSQDIFHSWKIGQKDKNNGILVAIFINDHKFRIQTGFGFAQQMPEQLLKEIQDHYMRPEFKQSHYYEGIDAGVDQLIYYTSHVYEPEPVYFGLKQHYYYIIYGIQFLLLALVVFLFRKAAKKKGKKTGWIVASVIFFLFPIFGGGALFIIMFVAIAMVMPPRSGGGGGYNNSHNHYYNDYSSSSSSSSSDSGSSFDGGGGGDSGGSGSSSDW